MYWSDPRITVTALLMTLDSFPNRWARKKPDQTFLRTHGSKQTKGNLVQGLRKY